MALAQPQPQAGPSKLPSVTPPASRPDTPASSSSRRSKKRKQNTRTETAERKAETLQETNETNIEPPPKKTTEAPQTQSDTFGDEDFIPFGFADTDEPAEEGEKDGGGKSIEKEPVVRPWNRGKPGQEEDRPGRKRKAGECDTNDGYANKKQRVGAASRRAPWAWDVDWERCQNVAQMMHQEVDAFVKYISPSPIEDEVRSMIVHIVRRAIVGAFPDAEVLPFGSYETKLYLPLGDIDLVILSPSMAYSRNQAVLHALANTVKRAGITDRVTIIAKAKVPIIKFVTRHGHFSVDISVNQQNGVVAGKIIRQFLHELPALRALVLVIKSFISQRSMNEVFTGGLGSFSIVCLAISFLQMHPKVRRGEIDPEQNLGTLVMEFFELYGCYFNYQEVGISLRDGGSYFNKTRRGWSDYRSPGLLSIEDPGDPTNDISRGTYGIAKVRATLAGAHGILTAAAYRYAGYINTRKGNRSLHLRQSNNPEEVSILASVMGVTQETINHRRLTREVYDSGVLHRMSGIEHQVPAPVEVKHDDVDRKKPNSNRSQRHAAESVAAAWSQADTRVDSDIEFTKRGEGEEEGEEEEEEESRYRASGSRAKEPPKKRRRMGRESDTHTVYTTDEGGEGGGSEEESKYVVLSDSERPEVVARRAKKRAARSQAQGQAKDRGEDPEDQLRLHFGGDVDDGVNEEETEYAIHPGSDARTRKRSFWLSKGIPAGDDSD